jgi:general secretion pathway protein E
MLIWGSKHRPSKPRTDRRDEQRAARPADMDGFLDFLAGEDLLDQGQVERLRATLKSGRFECLPVLVTELGFLSETDLVTALSRFCDLPDFDPKDIPDTPLLSMVLDRDLCQRKRCLVLYDRPEETGIAIVDPFDADFMSSIRYVLDRPTRFFVVGPVAFEAASKAVFGAEAVDGGGEGDENYLDDALDRLEDVSRRAPIIRLTNHIFRSAFDHGATDIHVEPGESELCIRYRVDGMLVFPETYPKAVHGGLSTRLKILSGLNIAERRLPQDGRMKMVDRGSEVDVRVSVLPTPHGESLVLRLLGRSLAAAGFSSLGFSTALTGSIRRMYDRPNGLFLVTGPTGSGKTTTLYSALAEVNDRTRKIITVEDPVEYRIGGVTQVQTQSDIGLNFAAALRSILRQDPDVVMIGEIRDAETAQIATQAALTGHLVLSTLHTNSAAAAVTRLIDMGLQPYLLAAVLNGVVAQRLLRLLCSACKTSAFANTQEELVIRNSSPSLRPGPIRLFRACGCDQCGGTGYRGRTVVAEALEVDRSMREMIADRASELLISDHARRKGMQSLAQSGMDRVLEGDVAFDDVIRSLDMEAMADAREAAA